MPTLNQLVKLETYLTSKLSLSSAQAYQVNQYVQQITAKRPPASVKILPIKIVGQR